MNKLPLQSVNLALASLRRHKLRTFLSVLGTSIGIMSLIVILSAGESLKALFDEQLKSFGTDYIEVEVKIPNTAQASAANAGGMAQGISITTLSLKDKADIDKIPNVKASYGGVLGQASVNTAFNEKRLQYFAVSPEFVEIDPTELESGRFFTLEEDRSLAKVVVIGHKVADSMFPNQDPIGQSMKIQKTRFKVIGVYKERGSASFFDMDDLLYLPLQTSQKNLLGFDHLLFIFAQLRDVSLDNQTADEMRSILRINHEITDPNKDDFAVMTQKEGNDIIAVIFGGVTLVLSLIASVALLVGGVGIMNIMYVAVNERVFEIGLRKAVGAPGGRIKKQFLTEAVIITVIGGIAGFLLALFFILLIFLAANYVGFAWPFAISWQSVIISLIFSSAVGLIFGYWPAKRAAELKPVDALNTNSF